MHVDGMHLAATVTAAVDTGAMSGVCAWRHGKLAVPPWTRR